jgi:hypothetical protein
MIKLRSLGLGLALMLGSAVGVGAAPFPNCPANSPGVVWLYQAPSGRIITQSAGPGSVPIAPSNPNAVPYLYQAGPERGLQQYRCRMAAPEHSVQGRCGKGYHREVGLLMNGRRGPTGCVADLTRSPHCALWVHRVSMNLFLQRLSCAENPARPMRSILERAYSAPSLD